MSKPLWNSKRIVGKSNVCKFLNDHELRPQQVHIAAGSTSELPLAILGRTAPPGKEEELTVYDVFYVVNP